MVELWQVCFGLHERCYFKLSFNGKFISYLNSMKFLVDNVWSIFIDVQIFILSSWLNWTNVARGWIHVITSNPCFGRHDRFHNLTSFLLAGTHVPAVFNTSLTAVTSSQKPESLTNSLRNRPELGYWMFMLLKFSPEM